MTIDELRKEIERIKNDKKNNKFDLHQEQSPIYKAAKNKFKDVGKYCHPYDGYLD